MDNTHDAFSRLLSALHKLFRQYREWRFLEDLHALFDSTKASGKATASYSLNLKHWHIAPRAQRPKSLSPKSTRLGGVL